STTFAIFLSLANKFLFRLCNRWIALKASAERMAIEGQNPQGMMGQRDRRSSSSRSRLAIRGSQKKAPAVRQASATEARSRRRSEAPRQTVQIAASDSCLLLGRCGHAAAKIPEWVSRLMDPGCVKTRRCGEQIEWTFRQITIRVM